MCQVAASIQPPKEDIRVTIKEKKSCEGDEWAFKFADIPN
jgi:hypothetical protein